MPPSADDHGRARHGKSRNRARTTNQRQLDIDRLDKRRLHQAIDESLLEVAKLESMTLTEPDGSDSHSQVAKQSEMSLAEPGLAFQCQSITSQVDVTWHVTPYTMASTKPGDSSPSGANANAAKEAPSEQGPAANPQHDHQLLSTAFMDSQIFEQHWPITYAAHKQWQRSLQVTPPTSDGTPPPNQGDESEEDAEAKADADAKKNQSCSLLSSHGP